MTVLPVFADSASVQGRVPVVSAVPVLGLHGRELGDLVPHGGAVGRGPVLGGRVVAVGAAVGGGRGLVAATTTVAVGTTTRAVVFPCAHVVLLKQRARKQINVRYVSSA